MLKDCLESLRQNKTCARGNMTERNATYAQGNMTERNATNVQISDASLIYLVPFSMLLIFMILVELLQKGISLK